MGRPLHKTRLSQIVAEGQREQEKEAKLAQLHEEVAKQEMKIQDLKDTIKELERQEAAANSIEVSITKEGEDADGVDLAHRRMTANPNLVKDSTSVGRKHVRGSVLGALPVEAGAPPAEP